MAISEYTKKASLVGAFFVSVCFSLLVQAEPICPSSGAWPWVRVAHVVDGDTLRLVDGRRVRLSSINAPELGAKGRPAEAFAVQAKQRLQVWLAASDGQVRLQTVAPGRDRYGRLLAHVYAADGSNLEARLLLEGLAFTAAFVPSSEQLGCLWQSETLARQARSGLWRRAPVRPASAVSRSGFAVLSARVRTQHSNAAGVWLELSEQLVLQIPHQLLDEELRAHLVSAVGRNIEVRGWVVDRGKSAGQRRARWLVKLSHPSMLKWH